MTAEWHLDIDAGRDIIVSVSPANPRDSSPAAPTVEVVDPDGTLVLDRSDGQGSYDLTTESTGQYVLRIRSGEWTKSHRWVVGVSWDPYAECE